MTESSFHLKEKFNRSLFRVISGMAAGMNQEVYVIGGYVRDLLLHRPSKDLDIMTVGDGIALAEQAAEALKLKGTVSVFRNFGTAMFRYRNLEVEFVGARKESYTVDSRKPLVESGTLEDDQKRRDFTINALAVSLNPVNYGELLDPFDGVGDLGRKLIRTPLDPDITFSDDPLRMMRGIRFATQLGFRIHDETLQAIAANKERIRIISGERVAEELNKIILSPQPSVGFILLEETGLLDIIFPELARMKGVDSVRGNAHKDNFYHTLKVLDQLAPHTDNLWLRWSALLHDIAKPATKKFLEGQGWTFHNHNFIGARMIPGIFRRLKLPLNEKMKFVQKMVELHMRPIVLSEEVVTDSAVRRLLFEAGDDIDELMDLCEADITSGNAAKVRKHLDNFRVVRQKLKEIDEKDAIRNFQPPISGEDIMAIFGLPPGKEVGIIKSFIREAILDGTIGNNREEAWNLMLLKGAELGFIPIP